MPTPIPPDQAAAAAQAMDARDALAPWRQKFAFPAVAPGQTCVYMVGNSLGLQPLKARDYISEVLDDWARLGVEGHFHARHPWYPYHEEVTEALAAIVGAEAEEVVAMNSLTVNLHLLMVSFYRPTPARHKIIVEQGAFPSDQYAVASQVRFHGYDPAEAIITLTPRPGEALLRTADIVDCIAKNGDSVALVLLGQVNYLTGQALDIPTLARETHRHGGVFGLDLAHGAGNLHLALHDWQVDFAAWCSYKYLNSGPGGIAGCFVHARHGLRQDLPRFAGWWGHDKQKRFEMTPEFRPIPGAEGWQLSNPSILALAALRASLELFTSAGMERLRQKSQALTGFLADQLAGFPSGQVEIITPSAPEERGCQLSLRMRGAGRDLVKALNAEGVFVDFRAPDVIRVAPVPLYNSFADAVALATALRRHVGAARPQ